MQRDTGTNNQSFDPTQIVDGTPIFDVGGDKVGTVSQYEPQDAYLIMQKGWFFPHDVYVPLDAIARQDADGLYLRYQKDDLKNMNWDQQPTMSREEANDTQTSRAGVISPEFDATGSKIGAQQTFTDQADARNLNRTAARDMNTRTDLGNEQTIDVPVREEELVAGKRQEDLGTVHVRKDVVQEQQTVTQPVTREEVHIERVPLQGQATDVGPDAFQERDIDIPVMGEELVVGKQARVTEEIRLRKDQITENQSVSDNVRKERVNIENTSPDLTQTDSDLNQPQR